METGISRFGNWMVVDSKDKWGNATGRFRAKSMTKKSMDNEGYKLSLNVEYSDIYNQYIAFIESRYCRMDLEFGTMIREIPVLINGGETNWKISSMNVNTRLMIEKPKGNRVRELWAKSKNFKLILSTEKWGDLVYDFDMYGAAEAIAKADKEAGNGSDDESDEPELEW